MDIYSRFTTGKWSIKWSIIALIFAACVCGCARQQTDRQPQLKVLVITDDRSFNHDAFFTMFDSFENVRWNELSHPEVPDLFGSDSIHDYDVMVFYDMPEEVILTDEQKQNMLSYFKAGAPAVFLHHTLLSYREWDQFPEIIGGRFYNKTPLITESGDTLQSTFEHDVLYTVSIADDQHLVTRGMEDFEIFDETYNHYRVSDDVDVLVTTDHPSSGHIIGWINTFGNSRVVYLMNGHGETAYENADFRRLLYNAINWVASGS